MEIIPIFRIPHNYHSPVILKRLQHSLIPQTSKVSNVPRLLSKLDPSPSFRVIMKDQINQVFQQAQKTFSSKGKTFEKHLQNLVHRMNKTTASDLNLDPQFMSEEFWSKPGKAPVTYIDLFDDDLMTMCVFVLKEKMKLPLHDHPEMYGLIKVLMGKVRIKSFSVDEDPELLYSGDSPIILTARKQPDIFADSKSDVCVLRPRSRNVHEIETIEGPAAFFDILSPPYDTPMKTANIRKCNYFEINRKLSDSSYKLMEVEPPDWFWNDKSVYSGPEIRLKKNLDVGVFNRLLSYLKNTKLWRVFNSRSRSQTS